MAKIPTDIALLIGLALTLILYSILLGQAVSYFRSNFEDRWWTKLVVSIVVLLETAMVLFDIDKLYLQLCRGPTYLILGPSALNSMLSGNTVMMSLVSMSVQLFFAWRVSALSSHRVLPGLIALCSGCSLALGLALHVMGISRITVSALSPASIATLAPPNATNNSFALVLSWLLMCAVVDIILSVYLTYYLLKKKTGFRSSDLLIGKIVSFTVGTGITTSVCAILDAGLHATHTTTIPMMVPDLMLSKLYANSLLASLNARAKWADDIDGSV
ncbi:hypothetical protein AB1N83_010014 [Pleurotus pulmonarius]